MRLICMLPNALWQPQQRAEKRKWMKLYPYDMNGTAKERQVSHALRKDTKLNTGSLKHSHYIVYIYHFHCEVRPF